MSKEKQIEDIATFLYHDTLAYNTCWEEDCDELAEILYEGGFRKMPDNIGDFSDGYHTFNELYHNRAVLFSVICNMFPEKAWKSKLHDSGDMYDGMFIVGIETEQGQATYHYDIEPYWDMFKVKELEKAPKYDGHTPSNAIARIGNLPCDGYRKQSEVAREIFKEILNIIRAYEFDALISNNDYAVFQVRNFGTEILKLKKKYTDSESGLSQNVGQTKSLMDKEKKEN